MLRKVLITLLVLLASSCASTDADRPFTDPLTAEGGSDAPSASGGTRGSNRPGAGSGAARSAAGTSGATSAPGAPPSGATGSPVKAPKGGVLRLGVHLSANAAAASAFGVPLPTHSPEKVDAIIAWLNANGGIAGRRVVPVYHTTDPLNGSFDQQAQETCATFTEDNDVDYVISAAQLYRDSLPACFAKAGVPLVWNVYFLTQRSVVPTEYLYRPAQPHADRFDAVVDGLGRYGFFKGAKIGLIRYDSAKHKNVTDKVYKPALARHGLRVAEEAALREPSSASGAGESASHASSIALRFNQAGVTHVVFVPSGGAIPLLFLAAAEGQSYRPRYGLSSADAPYFVRDSVPASQLQGAVGVGWAPPADLGPDSTIAQSFSPGQRRCVSISRKAGFAANESPTLYCDMLFYLRAALAGAKDMSVAALRDGTVARASNYESSVTFGTRFATGRHDGAAKARTFIWDGDWKYVGSHYPID